MVVGFFLLLAFMIFSHSGSRHLSMTLILVVAGACSFSSTSLPSSLQVLPPHPVPQIWLIWRLIGVSLEWICLLALMLQPLQFTYS